MKNLLFIVVLWLMLVPGCNQDATEDVVTPSDENVLSESMFSPLMSYRIEPEFVVDSRIRKGNAVERPIKFRSAGTMLPVAESDECPDQYKMVIEGSGIGSHIGTFTNHLYYCFIMGPGGMQLTSFVTGKVIAANGDEFYVVLTGAGTDPELGYFQSYMITGGSGRFTDASGSYTLYGSIDYVNMVYEHAGDGTIIY